MSDKPLADDEGWKPTAAQDDEGWKPVTQTPVNLADPGQKAIVDQSYAGRIMNAAIAGWKEGYGTDAYGLPPETVQALREHGVFNEHSAENDKAGTLVHVMRSFLESAILPAAQSLDFD